MAGREQAARLAQDILRDRRPAQGLGLGQELVGGHEADRGRLRWPVPVCLLDMEEVMALDTEFLLVRGRDDLVVAHFEPAGDGDRERADAERRLRPEHVHRLVQRRRLRDRAVLGDVPERARRRGHAPGRVGPVVPVRDRERVHESSDVLVQRVEHGPERLDREPEPCEVHADRPLPLLVPRLVLLVPNAAWDRLHDDVLGQPLREDPVSILAHDDDIRVHPLLRQLHVRFRRPDPEHEVGQLEVRQHGRLRRRARAVRPPHDVVLVRVRDRLPALGDRDGRDPVRADGGELAELLLGPIQYQPLGAPAPGFGAADSGAPSCNVRLANGKWGISLTFAPFVRATALEEIMMEAGCFICG